MAIWQIQEAEESFEPRQYSDFVHTVNGLGDKLLSSAGYASD